jgi:M6 family metalloprotease-like protein
MKKHIGVALGICLFLTLLSVSSVSSAPQVVGTKCAKAGTLRTVKTVRYRCKKSPKGLRWVVKSPKGTSITTTSTTTTTIVVPLDSVSGITSVSNLLNIQECRIRDVTFHESGISSGFPNPSGGRGIFSQLEVLVIPASFTDLPFTPTEFLALETTYDRVRSFYSAMSYGKATVRTTIAPSASWVDMGGTVEQNGLINTPPQWDGSNFYRRVIELYSQNNIIAGYDVVDVVSAYTTRFGLGQGLSSGSSRYGTGRSFSGSQILGRATQNWGTFAHELGHSWLKFEDLYLFSGGAPLGRWDTMSAANSEFSGWSRFLAGWIDSNLVRCASPNSPSRHYLSSLNADKANQEPRMLVLPLNSHSAVIAELRVPPVTWGSGFFTDINDPTLVVYRVDTSIPHGNGPIVLVGTIDQTNGVISTDGITMSVKGINSSGVIIDVSN